MKKIFSLLLVLMLCVSLSSCQSMLKKVKSYVTGNEESEMPDDYVASSANEEYEYDIYKQYIVLTKYIGESSEPELPSDIDGKPVTRIGALAFFDVEAAVTSVTIPSSVTEIEESAFYYAEHLESIVIPDTVVSLGTRAFAWCNSLESVTFGAGITSVPDYCFNHCVSLKEITFTENITAIGIRAFSYCTSLKDTVLPEGVSSVGERAFSDNSALDFVEFSDSDIEFGGDIFAGSSSVVVIAPEGSSAKSYCESNCLRWSTSRSVEAILLGEPDDSSDIME